MDDDTRQLLSRCQALLRDVEWKRRGQVYECPVEGGWSFSKRHRSDCELDTLLTDLDAVLDPSKHESGPDEA